MRIVVTACLIFLFWFMLSGHTEALLMILGVLSAILTVYLAKRMSIIDHEGYPFDLSWRLLGYYFYLGKEILKANVDVIKRILTPGRVNISPQVMTLPVNKKTALGKVIYANSITLTPGTVTLELSDDEIKVHALSKEGAEDLQKSDMVKAVPENEELSS